MTATWAAAAPVAASASACPSPKKAAKASLELRAGEVGYVHDLDTAGIREVVNDLQGYVAGPWHLPLGLTVADFTLRYETSFYYRKAQGGGHCVALAEARVSVGYDDITVYISSDYPEGSCEYQAILAHEQEHVEINRQVLKAHEDKLKHALRRLLRGKKVIYAHTKSEARAAYLNELRRQLDGAVARMAADRNRKNGSIDTQDSYRRVMAQCSHWDRDGSASSTLIQTTESHRHRE